jgi:hypothetical protein
MKSCNFFDYSVDQRKFVIVNKYCVVLIVSKTAANMKSADMKSADMKSADMKSADMKSIGTAGRGDGELDEVFPMDELKHLEFFLEDIERLCTFFRKRIACQSPVSS